MIRVAHERIGDLFAAAEVESGRRCLDLATRYVRLARRIGSRYNVRLLPEYRELYCRGCSTYWVEGATVRTRLRRSMRVRTCLSCGRRRRTLIRGPRPALRTLEAAPPGPAAEMDAVVAEAPVGPGDLSEEEEEE
ncbi:MAG TPA: hypothetical protein VFF67_06115 [Thermoplasmata archaeon]|nr:hypothetical protein [Thermoplasmata archaeon]